MRQTIVILRFAAGLGAQQIVGKTTARSRRGYLHNQHAISGRDRRRDGQKRAVRSRADGERFHGYREWTSADDSRFRSSRSAGGRGPVPPRMRLSPNAFIFSTSWKAHSISPRDARQHPLQGPALAGTVFRYDRDAARGSVARAERREKFIRTQMTPADLDGDHALSGGAVEVSAGFHRRSTIGC